jgi:hypothetical protein
MREPSVARVDLGPRGTVRADRQAVDDKVGGVVV